VLFIVAVAVVKTLNSNRLLFTLLMQRLTGTQEERILGEAFVSGEEAPLKI
jgi:hypothetical protein